MKEQTFPFNSKNFYEGTRTMRPTERACYMDLMIYQHQHGYVLDDPERMLQYCTGATMEEMLHTLELKFVKCDKGWYNEVLKNTLDKQESLSNAQAISGYIGQFWKKAKQLLPAPRLKALKMQLAAYSKEDLFELIRFKELDLQLMESLIGELFTDEETSYGATWKTDFNIYLSQARKAYETITSDASWIAERQAFHPNVNIVLSVKKACDDYWFTDAGWKNKKQSRVKEIDWKKTFNNALSQSMNRVYMQKSVQAPNQQMGVFKQAANYD